MNMKKQPASHHEARANYTPASLQPLNFVVLFLVPPAVLISGMSICVFYDWYHLHKLSQWGEFKVRVSMW